MDSARRTLLCLALAALATCTRGDVLLEPPPAEGVARLPSGAVVLWEHGWLDRLEAASPDLLAVRFPSAGITIEAMLLGDGDDPTAKVAPLSLGFPTLAMEWMDALGQGVGVRVAYGATSAAVQVTTGQGVCAVRASFVPLWVHLTFAFAPEAAVGAGDAAGLGALVPVGVPTLVGAEPPTIEPTACGIPLPEGLLDDLAAALQQEVRQRVAAVQLAFVQGVLDEVFTPWRVTGLRFPALGADARPLTWWMSLAPGSSVWRRELRLGLQGGAYEPPLAAPELPASATGAVPRDEGCLVRLRVPVSLLASLLSEAAARGLLSDEAVLAIPLDERPAWLPATPGLDVAPPFTVVAAPERLTGLDVASSAAGVTLRAGGTWRVRAYGRVEGTELLLGRARLDGSAAVELTVAGADLAVLAGVGEGAWSDVATPAVPLSDGWAAAALSAWARALVQAELGVLLRLVPPSPGSPGAPALSRLTLTGEGLEACYALPEEVP